MSTRKKSVTAWLSDSDKAMIDELCRDTGMSASEILTHLLRYVGRNRAELARIVDENIQNSLSERK